MNDGVTYDHFRPQRRAKRRVQIPPPEYLFFVPDGLDLSLTEKIIVRSSQPTENTDDGRLGTSLDA